MENEKVKLVKKLKYTDGNGEVYNLKNVIIIDLQGEESLEELLGKAIELSNKIEGNIINE